METAILDRIIQKWEANPDHLIMVLEDVQDEFGYLSKANLQYLADQLHVPLSRVYHVATFYKTFSLTPKGGCVIQVCMGDACVAKGSEQILDAFKRELQIDVGGTTEDRRFSLQGVLCLGRCSLAPVVTLNSQIFGEVKVSDVPKLIASHRKE